MEREQVICRDFEEGLREVFGNAGLLPKEN